MMTESGRTTRAKTEPLAAWCAEHTTLSAKPPVKAGGAHEHLPLRRWAK